MELTPLLAVGLVAAGVVIGIFSALFGVGGGLLMVPFIVLVLGEDQHVAEGTSLLVIVPTALAGVTAHHKRGYVSYRHAALLGVGGIAGGVVGAALAHRIDPASLQRVFGLFVVGMGLRFAWQGWSERTQTR